MPTFVSESLDGKFPVSMDPSELLVEFRRRPSQDAGGLSFQINAVPALLANRRLTGRCHPRRLLGFMLYFIENQDIGMQYAPELRAPFDGFPRMEKKAML